MKLIGDPPLTVEEWLLEFIKATKETHRRTLKPTKREWFAGRISGLESALRLVREATKA